MVVRKREIYIRLEKINGIVSSLNEIKSEEDLLRKLFEEYDKLNLEENKIFENWPNYLEDTIQKLEHVTL